MDLQTQEKIKQQELEEKKFETDRLERMKHLELLEKKMEYDREASREDREDRRKSTERTDRIMNVLLKKLEES